MKKAFLLLAVGMLVLAACEKPEVPSRDADLTGETVDAGSLKQAGIKKLFILNEGQMGSNNASLDMLRASDGNYVTGVFKKMNPSEAAGLGDVGNDIAVVGDEVWIVVNNSGIVDVLSAVDETEIAAIQVPTPRCLAFDDKYVYVSSWNGAVAVYGADWSVDAEQSKNPKGVVYRINRSTKKLDGSVEVGYQPEGLAVYDGKIYVANSGGISSQLPPDYAYDDTVSIIDAATFKVTGTVKVAVNLKDVWSDGGGAIYVSSLGNYWDAHTGLYVFYANDPSKSVLVGSGTAIKPEQLHVSCSYCCGNEVFCIGTENEYDWNSAHDYYIWSCRIDDYTTGKCTVSLYPQTLAGTPYGMAVIEMQKSSSESEGLHYLVLGDAGDYYNPGTVSCYALDFNDGEKCWSVSAGVCPGHFATW